MTIEAKRRRDTLRGPGTFKQSDVCRALRAAKAAGLKRPRIEITPGKITVIDDGEAAPAGAPGEQSEVENWITKHAHQS